MRTSDIYHFLEMVDRDGEGADRTVPHGLPGHRQDP